MNKNSRLPRRTYMAWKHMLSRCYTLHDDSYEYYGGRGIRVCERWHSFDNFAEDLGEVPAGYSLDRKDVNGDYCKENCRWATKLEQANNKRPSKRNVSGLSGVWWDAALHAWKVTKGSKYLGSFNNLLDAAASRKSAENPSLLELFK